LTTFRRVAEVRKRSAGYWIKAIIEIGIAIAIEIEIEIENTKPSPPPDNMEILNLDAVARG
jgi:hypothetical protein